MMTMMLRKRRRRRKKGRRGRSTHVLDNQVTSAVGGVRAEPAPA